MESDNSSGSVPNSIIECEKLDTSNQSKMISVKSKKSIISQLPIRSGTNRTGIPNHLSKVFTINNEKDSNDFYIVDSDKNKQSSSKDDLSRVSGFLVADDKGKSILKHKKVILI